MAGLFEITTITSNETTKLHGVEVLLYIKNLCVLFKDF